MIADGFEIAYACMSVFDTPEPGLIDECNVSINYH